MDSSLGTQEASPFLDFEALMEKLEAAATIPMDELEEDAESNNPHPEKIYMRSLHAIITLVKWAEISKDAGLLKTASVMTGQSSSTSRGAPTVGEPMDEWTEFIKDAESKISQLCSEMYSHDYVSSVEPFAIPTRPGCYIKTKGYVPGSISNSREFLLLFAGVMGAGDDGGEDDGMDVNQRLEDMRRRMMQVDFIPSSWSESLRPHPLSTRLARFDTDYDSNAILEAASRSTSVAQGVNSSVRQQQLINILQARAEVRQEEYIFEAEGKPRRMALGKNMVVISDERGKLQRYAIYPLGYDRSNENLRDWDGELMDHGLGGRVGELEIDSGGRIWAAGSSRIKAFGGWAEGELEKEERGECKLRWTLDSSGFSGALGITDEVVFRANTKGRLAVWRKENLVEHKPVWGSDSDPHAEPHGGHINTSWIALWGRNVEVSQGEPPHHIVEVPDLVGPFGLLSPIPGTSKFICAPSTSEMDNLRHAESFSVRLFDHASPESPASIVGLGFGATVASLATHQDMPHTFVAAGDDRCTRLFDLRQPPLPQIMLNGHSDNVNACTIASHGGDFPIIFTGGDDELVKAWDIRHTKKCMYELSTGTMHPTTLAWHEDTQSLFLLGKKVHQTDGPGDVVWPKRSARSVDYFGIPWYTLGHRIVEYRFRTAPDPRSFPWTRGYSSLDGPRFDVRY